MSTLEKVHTNAIHSRPSFYDLMRPRHLCSSLPFVIVFPSLHHVPVHITQHIALMAHVSKKKKSLHSSR